MTNAYNFRELIKKVIVLGGDTDTNGSITGALIGALYGKKKLSEDEITERI